MLGILLILGLAGCAQERIIPVGIQEWPGATASQLFPIYAELSGKTVTGAYDVLEDDKFIFIRQDCTLTYPEACKLIEDNLRGQAGIVIIRQDRKHVEFGFGPNKRIGS